VRPAPGPCPACGGALSPWRRVPGSEPEDPGPFELERCGACGTARTVTPAAGGAEPGGYASSPPRLQRAAAPVLELFARERLALARRAQPPPARLLDVGAGRGRFVAAAARAGYAAVGIEPGPGRAAIARERGAEVQTATLETAEVPSGSVDVVTLWHVLEHVEDPGAALKRVASWLAPGGALVVAVPNLASLQARLGGDAWMHWDLPRHRTHFTPAGLSRLLAAHGLPVQRTRHVLLEHNPFGMWQSLVSRVTREPSLLYRVLARRAPVRGRDLAITAIALPAFPAAAALEAAAGALGRGGTLAAIARRG
jgi:2-polyprenyl-3-methyl-5-hydroxy-6-metoxy-1,4-benzoquinol methylase